MPEEPFVPGVDPGLKAWLKMRQDVRDARSKGTNTYTITSEFPYKYHYHWIDLLFSFEEEEFRRLLISNSVSEHSWNKVNTHNICTNDEFENMLLMVPRDKEKLYYSAIYHRSLVLLTNLIEREGMNINYRFTKMKRTLLQLAVQHGDLLKVAYLLQHHAKVTLKDIHQRTALHLAMQSELTFHPVDIPRMLIEAGATVNGQDEHGRTPLHYACLVGSSRLVRLLLENGADMTIEDEKMKTPLNYSSNHSVQEVFAEFSMFHGRKQQYLKVQARIVATRFISDIFQVVQPKCPVCKRTLSNCKSLKFSNYRYWMHAHGRFKKEMYKPKVKTI